MHLNYTVEVEATNYCNANCVFCANKTIVRPRGFLDVGQFSIYIEKLGNQMEHNIFRKYGIKDLPRVTFCGLGEPLMHPQIDKLILNARKSGFYTQLVTNGVLLTPEKLSKLIKSGLNEIAISFHSMNPVHYHAITGLELKQLQKVLLLCKDILSSDSIKVMFWRIKHPDARYHDDDQDQASYDAFIQSLGLWKSVVLGPSEPWSRDGYVPDSKCDPVSDTPFWCNKLIFTMNIDWQGNLVICCNDYNREQVYLGNVFDYSFQYMDYMKKKKNIFLKTLVPKVCRDCRRWADNEVNEILMQNHIDSDAFFKDVSSCLLLSFDNCF